MTGSKPVNPARVAELKKAADLHRAGRVKEASALYMALLRDDPQNFDLNHMAGLASLQLGDAAQAVRLITAALRLTPASAQAEANLGSAYAATGDYDEALAHLDLALSLDPSFHPALFRKARVLQQTGKPEQALAAYEQAQSHGANDAALLNNKGAVLRDLGRVEEALASFDAALAVNAQDVNALINKANTLRDAGRMEEAFACYDRSLSLAPFHPEALVGKGKAREATGDAQAALELYRTAMERYPAFTDARVMLAQALLKAGDAAQALEILDKVLAEDSGNVSAWARRAVVLEKLKQPEKALESYDRALALDDRLAGVHMNRGILLQSQCRYGDAAAALSRAIELAPDKAAGYVNLGNLLQEQRHYQASLESYDRALAAEENNAQAHYNRGRALSRLSRDEEALDDYNKAFVIDRSITGLEAVRLHTKMMLCDWSDYASVDDFLDRVREGQTVAPPFVLVGLSSRPEDQLACARRYVEKRHPAQQALWTQAPQPEGRIRIGYLSCDLHRHATAYLMAGLFEQHDREQFETFAFSFGVDDRSDLRARLESSFDHFIDISRLPDADAVRLIHEKNIDILVDLKGFTQDNRADILARRPAPVQVNYLGYPATMGAPYIDYLIADRHLIPEEDEAFYTEKILCLPDSYQPNDDKRFFPDAPPSRESQGLPDDAFVFCSFNNTYKITPVMFDIWMRLLHKVPDSVFWLFDGGGTASRNLRREAEARGIDPSRLVFAPKIKMEDHLARQACADLFLDSLPCNAHTTASDALWAGLPLVTCRGRTFAGRVASSLLHALELPELVTENLEDYEALALSLASDRQKLAALRAKLAQKRQTAPLFNTLRTTRQLESIYNKIAKGTSV